MDIGCLKDIESKSSSSKVSRDEKLIGNVLDNLYRLGEDPSPKTGSSDTSGPLDIQIVRQDEVKALDGEEEVVPFKSLGLTIVNEEISQENYDSLDNPLYSNRQQFYSLGSKASDQDKAFFVHH